MTSATVAATGKWTATGNMPAAAGWYGQHDNAIVLSGTKVLVMGGADGSAAALTRAAVYDHATKTWTATGSLQTSRRLFTATRLADGKVLVAGGISGTAQFPAPGLAAAEIYDPETGTWTSTGSMRIARWGHCAVLVGDKVLVAGGTTMRSAQSVKALHSAELFDPHTGTWTETAPMTDARSGHPALVLANGRVLVVGGTLPTARDEDTALAYCELFDPTAGTWSPTGALLAPRSGHQATVLSSGGAVLVTGGRAPGGPGDGTFDPFSRAGAELYLQDTGRWTAAPDMPGGRALHRAVRLGTTRVLVVGGSDGAGDDVGYASAAVFDFTTRSWSTVSGLSTGRFAFAAAPLSDKLVLVAGGVVRSGLAAARPDVQDLTATSEVFDVDAAVTS
ncbi:kelch repeat-containing protein [Streptomyces sp. Root264]|uniref:Kelch repeat-containing protein n=1 Tax=Streptomyces sp. Root264 TaxID=1736503 RepID=UPI00070A13DC|nr:kelch repeat-containing protein [Streptomyces sp. Root264]KRD23514.1 Kelch-like protein 17 [Streptomyces sp. Root264]